MHKSFMYIKHASCPRHGRAAERSPLLVYDRRYGAGGVTFPAVEADFPAQTLRAANARGAGLGTVNPWNWGMGSFEAIHIDPDSGLRTACGDPRRNAMAEAVEA